MKQRKSEMYLTRYGPWAIVTGASSGIGRECAKWLAAVGFDLVLVARREPELQQLARELGRPNRIVVADLADPAGLAAVEAATADLDVGLLVAAAGFGTSGLFLEGDLKMERTMLDLNCGAVLSQSRHFGTRFARRGRGGIVLFGSLVGFQGAPWAANYAATKAYVQTLAEGLHVELAPHGVDVIASAPGPVHSGFAAQAKMKMGVAEQPASVARATMEALGCKMTVTPGVWSKFLTFSIMTAPRSLRARIMGTIMRRMALAQGR